MSRFQAQWHRCRRAHCFQGLNQLLDLEVQVFNPLPEPLQGALIIHHLPLGIPVVRAACRYPGKIRNAAGAFRNTALLHGGKFLLGEAETHDPGTSFQLRHGGDEKS